MSRRVAFWIALPATILTVGIVLLMLTCIVMAIWGDPDLADRLVASAFLCAFVAIGAGGVSGFAWMAWGHAPRSAP